ncbi:MAG: response regulator [Candidatus Hodarchaeales archaeon]|jgi:two-component system chemotaxis response regulator CheY
MVSVLICDDIEFIRSLLRKVLSKEGHIIVGEAKTGLEVIEMYKQISPKPDLVTMDIMLPGKINGIQAVEEILQINPKAKIIIITALNHKPLADKALQLGALEFIVKPFTIQDLIDIVKSIFL